MPRAEKPKAGCSGKGAGGTANGCRGLKRRGRKRTNNIQMRKGWVQVAIWLKIGGKGN